jgi:hypothetical protein
MADVKVGCRYMLVSSSHAQLTRAGRQRSLPKRGDQSVSPCCARPFAGSWVLYFDYQIELADKENLRIGIFDVKSFT